MTADMGGHVDTVVLLHVRKPANNMALTERRLIFSPSTTSWEVGRTAGPRKPLVNNAIFSCPVVSRVHAKFSFNRDTKLLYLTDLGSSHGTHYYPDKATGWQKLKPKEQIVVSEKTWIQFGKAIHKPGEHNDPLLVWVTFGPKPLHHGESSATVQKVITMPMEPSHEPFDHKDSVLVEKVSSPTSPADQGKPGCYGITDDKVLYPSDVESDEQDDVADATQSNVHSETSEVIETKTVLYVPDSLSKPAAIIIDPIDNNAGSVELQDAIGEVQKASFVSELTTKETEALKTSLSAQVESYIREDMVQGITIKETLKGVVAPLDKELIDKEDAAMTEEKDDPEWSSDMERDVESSDEDNDDEPQIQESDCERISDDELQEVKQLADGKVYGVERQHQAYVHDELVAKTIRIRELEDEVGKVQSHLSEIQGQNSELRDQLAEKTAKMGAEKSTRSEAERLTKELQIEVTVLQNDLSKIKDELVAVKCCHSDATDELADLELTFDSEITNLRAAEAEVKSLKGQLAAKAIELEALTEKCDDLLDVNQSLEDDFKDLTEEIEILTEQCDAKDKLLHHIKTVHLSPKDEKAHSSNEMDKSSPEKADSGKEIDPLCEEGVDDGYDRGYFEGLKHRDEDSDGDICSDCEDDCSKVACRVSRSWDDGYEAGRQDGAMEADTEAAYEQGYEDGVDCANEQAEWTVNRPAQLLTPAASPAGAKKDCNVMGSEVSKSSDSEGEITTTSISPFKVLSPLVLKRKREEAASDQPSIERPVKRTRKVLTIVAHAAIGALAGSIGTIAGLAALGGGQD